MWVINIISILYLSTKWRVITLPQYKLNSLLTFSLHLSFSPFSSAATFSLTESRTGGCGRCSHIGSKCSGRGRCSTTRCTQWHNGSTGHAAATAAATTDANGRGITTVSCCTGATECRICCTAGGGTAAVCHQSRTGGDTVSEHDCCRSNAAILRRCAVGHVPGQSDTTAGHTAASTLDTLTASGRRESTVSGKQFRIEFPLN